MKTWRAILILLLAATLSHAAETGLDIEGAMTAGERTLVRLINRDSGTAAWVAVGGTFNGYVVASFEPDTGIVTLSRNGTSLRLQLKTASIAQVAAPTPITLPPESERAIMNNLRQIGAAADQYYLEHGTNRVTLADLVGPDKYIRELRPVAGENYEQLTLVQGEDLVITVPGGPTYTYKQ